MPSKVTIVKNIPFVRHQKVRLKTTRILFTLMTSTLFGSLKTKHMTKYIKTEVQVSSKYMAKVKNTPKMISLE